VTEVGGGMKPSHYKALEQLHPLYEYEKEIKIPATKASQF